MRKPELNISNYQDVYDFYSNSEISPNFAKFAHFVFGLMYKPRIRIDSETKQQIDSTFKFGGRLILASNHVNNKDQYVLGAAFKQSKPLNKLVGNTVIPAKVELFDNLAMRSALDAIGAIPAFRSADLDQQHSDYRIPATKRMIDVVTARMLAGNHLAIFPEGTRNRGNPAEVAKIKSGVSRIAMRVAEYVPVTILPVGINYDDAESGTGLVNMHIGAPLSSPFNNRSELSEELQYSIQNSVDTARTSY